jgi:hypothetical protein
VWQRFVLWATFKRSRHRQARTRKKLK